MKFIKSSIFLFAITLAISSCNLLKETEEPAPDLFSIEEFSGINQVQQTGYSPNNEPPWSTNWDTLYNEEINFRYGTNKLIMESESGTFDAVLAELSVKDGLAHFSNESFTRYRLFYYYEQDSISVWVKKPGNGICDCYYVNAKL